jgi:hypothetical protein
MRPAAEGGAVAEERDPFIGTVVAGRYRVVDKLGEGSMGAVYRGVHEALRNPVAIKFLLEHRSASKEMVARFEREAIAAANLQHPNIAAAMDLGRLPDGTFFLVMELVEGTPLRVLLSRAGRLPPSRALHILRQLGAALTRAHSVDIVHRDLKPENVIVFDRGTESDNVKVIDFGIARMKSSTFGGGATQLTRMGSVLGTPHYMSPEQVVGQPADARADQYALGVMAFEMLAGRVPFQTQDGEVMYMHLSVPVPKITDHARDLPEALNDVLARMMAKTASERFASVADAIAAITQALGDHSRAPGDKPASSVSAGARSAVPDPNPRRRLPRKLMIGALAALWVAGIVVVSLRLTIWRGGDLSDAMSHWRDKRYADASSKLQAAFADRPGAAEDADLTRTLAGSLRDRQGQRELQTLMNATPLGRSRAMAGSLASVALGGEKDEREASLTLLAGRLDLLSAEDRARVSLRGAEDCEALNAALALLVALGPGPGQDDIKKLSSSDCNDLLRRPALCQQCLKARGRP